VKSYQQAQEKELEVTKKKATLWQSGYQ